MVIIKAVLLIETITPYTQFIHTQTYINYDTNRTSHYSTRGAVDVSYHVTLYVSGRISI